MKAMKIMRVIKISKSLMRKTKPMKLSKNLMRKAMSIKPAKRLKILQLMATENKKAQVALNLSQLSGILKFRNFPQMLTITYC